VEQVPLPNNAMNSDNFRQNIEYVTLVFAGLVESASGATLMMVVSEL
jgi:hypothetical protein